MGKTPRFNIRPCMGIWGVWDFKTRDYVKACDSLLVLFDKPKEAQRYCDTLNG